jgi:plastocyanin
MKTSTRTRFFLLSALILAQFSALAATYTITVGDTFYSPQNVDAHPGDKIVWQWQSGSHPTVFDKAEFASFQMNSSSTSHTITIPATATGLMKYHCSAHAFLDNDNTWQGMIGSISVSTVTPVVETRLATPVLSVYPNPSKGMVMVSVGQKAGESYKMRLSNIIGREVRMIALKPETATEGVAVNLSDLPAGVYFYSLLVNDKVISTKRLILQN